MNLDISLDLYKIFCTVVKTGNMSAAAKELFITQPAVSMAIRQLEDKLGKPLLIRSSKGITATAEGSVMYEYLSQALGHIKMAEKKYLEMTELKMGEVRLSASDIIMGHFLLPFIEAHLKTYPDINFQITNRTTHGTLNLIKNSQIDIGFVNLPLEHNDSLEILECLEIHDCIIGGTKYKNLRNAYLNFEQLNRLPLMLLDKGSNSRRFQDKFASANGYILSPAIELGGGDLLVSCAKINLGLAIVTKEFTDIDNKTIFEIPFKPSFPKRAVGLVKLKGVSLSHAAESFLQLITAN